ncbi:MAG TPA: lysophospholipid acyltransferase family protein [Fimbriiglobus sp.]|jgi:1-acyl-sn-glycerol-3-phosphate acyltransferase
MNARQPVLERLPPLAFTLILFTLAAFGDLADRALGRYATSREEEGLSLDLVGLFFGSSVVALVVTLVSASPYRVRAWIPILAGLEIVAWAVSPRSFHDHWYEFALLHGFVFGGSIGVGTYLAAPRVHRGIHGFVSVLLAGICFWSIRVLFEICSDPRRYYGSFLIVAGVTAFVSLAAFVRPLFECFFEIPTRVCYRIRARGPGIPAFPARGPVLVIANHSSYMDPLFLAGDVPRPISPMMTSKFYDRPLFYPFVRFVFGVIRVPDKAVRREAPELAQAVAALDRGKCLVIFPEGFLQRKADQPLRRFGRGVVEILKARPETPVVAAWIEGAWGSFFSYANGPPAKGKRPDFRRPIDVGYSAPFTVPKDLLSDHWATRYFLMNKVGEARGLVGRPRIPEMILPAHEVEGHHTEAEARGEEDESN